MGCPECQTPEFDRIGDQYVCVWCGYRVQVEEYDVSPAILRLERDHLLEEQDLHNQEDI